jgi:hypothetical protein
VDQKGSRMGAAEGSKTATKATAKATTKVTPAPAGTGRRKAKWIALAAVVVVGIIAVASGLFSYGLAKLRSATFPSDESMLAWVPNDVGGFAIIDPHRLELTALGPEQGAIRTTVERVRTDIKKATGIDLAYHVDKLLLSPSLIVARGRFDGKQLTERLTEHRYLAAEHRGVSYLVRAGEDAIAVISDDTLLYGDEASLKHAFDAKESGASMKNDGKITERLDEVGWNHPLLFTLRITDDKPSLREIVTGSTGPRALTVGVRTGAGADVDAALEAATPSAAAELQKLLDEKRANPEALGGYIGAEAGKQLGEIAKSATITHAPESSTLMIHARIPPEALDAAARAMAEQDSVLTQRYKAFRLWQLLVPDSPASTQPAPTPPATTQAPSTEPAPTPPAPLQTAPTPPAPVEAMPPTAPAP